MSPKNTSNLSRNGLHSTNTPSGASVPKRRRGGQLGNRNALKHGFYSNNFRRADLKDLDSCEFIGLKDEISMLRVYIRRCIEMSDQLTTLTESMELLRALSLATLALNRLIRTQHLIIPEDDPIQDALHRALEEVWAEIDQDGYGNPPRNPAKGGHPPAKEEHSSAVEENCPPVPTIHRAAMSSVEHSSAPMGDYLPPVQGNPPPARYPSSFP